MKTVNFKDPKYVGDPLNVVKILNEKEVDELMIMDINASSGPSEINFRLLENIAAECRMPLCYGGGVSSLDDFTKLIKLGVEKVSVSTALVNDFGLIRKASDTVGAQSIVGVLDVKKDRDKYWIYLNNGTQNTGLELKDFVNSLDQTFIGELVINSVDRDGTLAGYDFELLEYIYPELSIPLTVLGGASSYHNIRELFLNYKNVGAGVGSLFVFRGKFKAVLVSYPYGKEKISIIE